MAKDKGQEFYIVIEEGEDGYYVAEVPQLRGCYTQARSLDELMVRVREAIHLCLEDIDDKAAISPGLTPKFIGIQKVTI
ncbi:type II toxin-antitoxin system HicB family antitoxin [Candidatus Acetothermia bacterium]|jgi:predicted RNase H-like HicB family nuclease|nr:type II toxin-antitoxin system HicB family antitoxin [Candidatus Acetothermia bacterium]MCI2431727.1 type II toxin-antitoxin system HicB family antitoxin [Candidatus Acetothermia bacterium]MCI2436677.1 type II toxin-antitoxin system HicB family antitoxin [Candidatus Acetothermia bacterium]